MSTSSNPVLSRDFRIPFHRIRAEHVVPGIRSVLDEARDDVEALASAPQAPSYRGTVRALDRITQRVRRAVTPVRHLTAVAETPELREAYNEVLPEITRFWTWLHLHRGLWDDVRAVAEGHEAEGLEGVHARHLEKTVREFRRAGAELAAEGRRRLEELKVELSELEQRFSENVLDATADYALHVTDGERLEGVPDDARERFLERARDEGREGWTLTLDYPSYEAVVKHAHDRALREELHRAYVGRCRDGERDNRGVIASILALRVELAELLGYPDFPDYRLQESMAGGGDRARSFLRDLVERTEPYFGRDVELLREHGRAIGIDELEPWDVAYVKESLRRERYDIDDEALRPYFPLAAVLEGLFGIARRLFGVSVREEEGVEEVWHEDVRCFRVEDAHGLHLGDFYADFHPRKEKRQGAWMNHFITGGPDGEGGFEPHLGFIAANLTPPRDDGPALLTHREVQTLFHEFGHLLHHLLSRVEVAPRAGLRVAWDFVELPSQLLENWTWEKEALDLFAGHHETGEALPDELVERMIEARRFAGGWDQMRQLSLGSLDLALHLEFEDGEDGEAVERFAEEALLPFVPGPRFARLNILTTFHHLFSGGYAAGYYSYLWSEVLDADAFRRFRREGIFNRSTGREFVEAVLSRGDSAEPSELFREFMGREPDPMALVRRNLGEAPADDEIRRATPAREAAG